MEYAGSVSNVGWLEISSVLPAALLIHAVGDGMRQQTRMDSDVNYSRLSSIQRGIQLLKKSRTVARLICLLKTSPVS